MVVHFHAGNGVPANVFHARRLVSPYALGINHINQAAIIISADEGSHHQRPQQSAFAAIRSRSPDRRRQQHRQSGEQNRIGPPKPVE